MPETYKIESRDEECPCSECGAPLYVGDTAIESDDEENVYCSEACMNTDKVIRHDEPCGDCQRSYGPQQAQFFCRPEH